MKTEQDSIDYIWDALKQEEQEERSSLNSKKNGSSTKSTASISIAHLWESIPSKKKLSIDLQQKERNTSHNFNSDDKDQESIYNMLEKIDSCMEIVQTEMNDETSYIGDSDDDSDIETKSPTNEEEPCTTSDSMIVYCLKNDEEHMIHPTKLHRLVALMRSDDVSHRKGALKSVFEIISKLYNQIYKKIPELNFPPPYDLSKIALTHKQYGSVVSDLAKGDYVTSWTKWQRTKSSISDQFPEKQKYYDEFSKNQEDCEHKEDNINISKCLQSILNICATTLFRRFSDGSESCRSMALDCMKLLCLSGIDVGKHLGYLMPAILGKYKSVSFDDELNVFVEDMDDHMFYKRGGATERQDRSSLLSGSQTMTVIDQSEEIRNSICELLSCIVRCFVNTGQSSTLDAYFSDIILALQSHLKDPFPTLKIEASNLLVQILRIPQWEEGSKIFATALARVAIPNLRHRNSKVRISAIKLFEASVSVPNREKVRGAGTDAIVDIVGFREDHVLPIAAFYKRDCGVAVNTLAEVVADRVISVRLSCCEMISFLINCLPDRYEHQTRLLPYLLIFFNDGNHKIQMCAMDAINSCGEQYEAEHPNDIIERRQYGVDGDQTCNHKDKLPPPFTKRPRLGSRLFVRANTKRFFGALLSELTCWQSKTRIQSAKLLCILAVYCEEHLTMDCNKTILSVVKALHSNLSDGDVEGKTLHNLLLQLFELMGRYIEPSIYTKILLPRVVGDVSSATTFSEGGIHSESSCVANTIALRSMMKGTLPHVLMSQFFALVSTLTSSVLQFEMKGTKIKREILQTLETLFVRLEKQSFAGAQSACFHNTGRIHNYEDLVMKCEMALENLTFKPDEADLLNLTRNITEMVKKRN